MQFNSVRTGNYAQAASAVTKNTDSIYDTARATSADFTKIAKEVLKGRSNERQTADAAKYKAEIQKMKGEQLVKLEKMQRDLDKNVRDIKRPAQRMAGITAALGSLSEAYGYGVERRERKEAAEKREARELKRDQQIEDLINNTGSGKFNPEDYGIGPRPQAPQFDQDGNLIQPTDPGSSQPTATGVSTATAPTKTGTTVTTSGPAPKGSVSRKEVFDYLTTKHGLSKNKAYGIMANIDRESSFRIAPPGGDQGNSFGMFQWNNTYGRSDLMKQNVPDWQTNWKGQIDHALSQNQLPEYNQFTTQFKNTTFATPQAAADSWMKGWERPADVAGGSKKHSGFLSGYNF